MIRQNTNMGQPSYTHSKCCRITIRHIFIAFLALSVLALLNLLSSTSKLSVIVDVSMKMKADVLDTIHDIIDIKSAKSVNGSFSVRTFKSTSEMNHNFKQWMQKANNSNYKGNVTTAIKHQSNSTVVTDINGTSMQVNDGLTLLAGKTVLNNDTNIKMISINTVTESEMNRSNSNRYANITEVDNSENTFTVVDDKRQNSCESCFEHNFNYVIDNVDICKLEYPDQVIDVIVLILTTHTNSKARIALRTTWLTYTQNNTANVRYAFLLGETEDLKAREAVLVENSHFHDILKEDFVDTYVNLTYKTIMGFKWAATKCAHSHYVMKTDDDMFVNLPNVLKLVKRHGHDLQNAVGGACSQKAAPIRNKKSKWYASYKSYPSTTYPGFCSGTGYVTSMNVARKVYELSPSIPFFHLEDVYVAICIRKLGYRLNRYPGFNAGRPKLDPCLYKGNSLITAHQLTPLTMMLIWNRKCRIQSIRVPFAKPIDFTNHG